MMIYVHCLVLLLLAGQVELIKFSLKAPAPIQQQQPLEQAELPPPQTQQPIQQQAELQQYQDDFYPSRQQPYGYQQQQQQQQYGRPQSYYPAYQPPALAYVIVRPLAPSYPYYSPQVRYTAPLFQAPVVAAPQESGSTKGGRLQPAEQYSTKDGTRPEYIREEDQTQQKEELFPQQQQQQQQILQHQQPIQQQPFQQQQQPEQLHDAAMGKWLKFKSSIDKFAASARSKLTLGSSRYYVQGEEIVPPQAAPQPLQQEQVRTNDIQLTKDEQQRIEDARSTKQQQQQQQQHYDDNASQAKLEDTTSQATKLEETRGTKQQQQAEEQPARQQQVKLEEAARGTKQLDEQPQPARQPTKLEASAADGAARKTKAEQELKLEQEPQREKEKDLEQVPVQQAPLQQAPLQQERYNSEKGQQQQREEYRAPVKSDREQLRLFNGQQPAPTYIDSDGFGSSM